MIYFYHFIEKKLHELEFRNGVTTPHLINTIYSDI